MSAQSHHPRRTRKHLLLVVPQHDVYIRLMMLIEEASPGEYMVDWAATYRFAVSLVKRNAYDTCLVSSRVGTYTITEFAEEANQLCANLPIIQLNDSSDIGVESAENTKLWDRLETEKLSPRLLCDTLRDASRTIRA